MGILVNIEVYMHSFFWGLDDCRSTRTFTVLPNDKELRDPPANFRREVIKYSGSNGPSISYLILSFSIKVPAHLF